MGALPRTMLVLTVEAALQGLVGCGGVIDFETTTGAQDAAADGSLAIIDVRAADPGTLPEATSDGQFGAADGGSIICTTSDPAAVGNWQCGTGFVHRAEPGACPTRAPWPTPTTTACSQDSDCREYPHGFCRPVGGIGCTEGCWCAYGCVRDEDCRQREVCVCDDPVGICVSAGCSVDSDCGQGSICSAAWPLISCIGSEFACQTAADECHADSDCKPSTTCVGQCTPLCRPDGTRFRCAYASCD